MQAPEPANRTVFRDKTFVLLVVAVTLAFGLVVWPFFGAVFWATTLSILFAPLHRRLTASMGQRRTLAALATLAIVLLIVILPAVLIAGLLVQEALGVYARLQSGELDLGRYVQQILGALPASVMEFADRMGLTDLAAMQERLSAGLMRSIQLVGTQAVNVGQNTLDFVVDFFIMLYLMFFLFRDSGELRRRIRNAVPLQQDLQQNLFDRFARVIRATVKGSIVVAVVQGALGGLIFWFLGIKAPVFWAVLMAFLSLLPVVGTGLVWLPVAVYFLLTGSVGQGVVLIAYGVLVIGLVDNILRPLLVGKDTKMPDYVVLISTLGGIAIFGMTGFVIGPVIAALFIAVWDVVAASRGEPAATHTDR
jgi:predicted PurR-regulated permease PerM